MNRVLLGLIYLSPILAINVILIYSYYLAPPIEERVGTVELVRFHVQRGTGFWMHHLQIRLDDGRLIVSYIRYDGVTRYSEGDHVLVTIYPIYNTVRLG